jgi:DnaJ domain
MIFWLVGGTLLLVVLLFSGRWFVRASPGDLAQAARTFIAVFGTLASTGLLIFGRFGLALIALAAVIMAIRSLRLASSGPEPMGHAGARAQRSSNIETPLLRMHLDHATGALDGEVLSGGFAGRTLASLTPSELRALLDEAQRVDPTSESLIEAYLDRRDPGWRTHGQREDAGPAHGDSRMDERTALEILGLERGATGEEIKAAHRKLMGKLHPDRGGSTYLASQINRAKEYLLARNSR